MDMYRPDGTVNMRERVRIVLKKDNDDDGGLAQKIEVSG